jgi:hypothetical protein
VSAIAKQSCVSKWSAYLVAAAFSPKGRSHGSRGRRLSGEAAIGHAGRSASSKGAEAPPSGASCPGLYVAPGTYWTLTVQVKSHFVGAGSVIFTMVCMTWVPFESPVSSSPKP